MTIVRPHSSRPVAVASRFYLYDAFQRQSHECLPEPRCAQFALLATDPHEQVNLSDAPGHKRTLTRLRAVLDAWLVEQGDQQKTLALPRMLSEPHSYGASAEIRGALPQKESAK